MVVEAEPPHRFWARPFPIFSAAVIIASAVIGFGLKQVNTDPSLLEYFKPNRPLRDGLEYVDRNGGSDPLTVVVAAADGRPLNHKDEYKQLWTLQEALEQQPAVGTVISLPLLLAEGRRRPLSFLVSTEHMLETLEEPKYGRVARTFITPDRMETAFYLRMIERDPTTPRLDVVRNVRAVVRRHGF